ncbi:HDOD domain-containing protein [Campylobacter sp. TTU_617]|uniref:HDOD domain-containing protein n=1 Tax=Campylobacter sp. TTU_617 TaxID=2768148 RepID=UPI001903A680|nr:HDOD domain-containing protein [Campylobacter sp. TTU_617]MBK1971788.1 HDOD domain-containing protein [Campylobacter sp. TTU_617]
MQSSNEDINEILLKSVETLPPLPDTIIKLNDYIEKSGANIETNKVAEIISNDPLITAKLLKLANSPYYGFSREITTINQVITLLGIANIKNLITADSIKDNFKVDLTPYGLDTSVFLNTCREEILFISNWLNEEDKQLSYLLAPCALLLRLGMIVFANFLMQNNKDKEFLEYLKKTGFDDVKEAENKYLGVDHISFLGFLLHRWNFDESLVETICFIHTPHSASEKIKKSSYALSVIDHLFTPYNGGSSFNVKTAIALLEEANLQGISFDIHNFLSKLPPKVKENLNKN